MCEGVIVMLLGWAIGGLLVLVLCLAMPWLARWYDRYCDWVDQDRRY